MYINFIITQGVYWLNNFVMEKLPPIFQIGHWKIQIKIYYKDALIIVVQMYFKIIGIGF